MISESYFKGGLRMDFLLEEVLAELSSQEGGHADIRIPASGLTKPRSPVITSPDG